MTTVVVERTCVEQDLEEEISKEVTRLQRQMASGRPLVETLNDVYGLHASVTLARLRLELAADRLASRAVIAQTTRRLGEVLRIPGPSNYVRPQDLW